MVSRGPGQERRKPGSPSLLIARSRLVSIRRDLENQVRSLLKEIGLLFPRAIGSRSATHVRSCSSAHALRSIVEGLLAVHEQVEQQQAALDKRVRKKQGPTRLRGD